MSTCATRTATAWSASNNPLMEQTMTDGLIINYVPRNAPLCIADGLNLHMDTLDPDITAEPHG